VADPVRVHSDSAGVVTVVRTGAGVVATRTGFVFGASAAIAVAVAVDIGLEASDVLSTLLRPTSALVSASVVFAAAALAAPSSASPVAAGVVPLTFGDVWVPPPSPPGPRRAAQHP
jgi:hypothetical protein